MCIGLLHCLQLVLGHLQALAAESEELRPVIVAAGAVPALSDLLTSGAHATQRHLFFSTKPHVHLANVTGAGQ